MKHKAFRFAIMGILVVVALAAFVPVASASMVTRIMLAQGNVETFAYTATGNGSLYVSISWVDHLGVASSFPASEVDGAIAGPSTKSQLYLDYDVKTLYAGTNPVIGTQTVASGSTYYISVYPYVDDCTATVTIKLGGAGGTNVTATRMSDGASVTSPYTVAANAADGEVYPPSNGTWVSTFQNYAGTSSLYYADYNDYVYQRVTGSTYDTLSEAYAFAYYQGQLGGTTYGYQIVQRATMGGGSNPKSAEWYSVTPQIWPAADRPNVADAMGNIKEGALLSTAAPAWYTYAFEDASVATQAPGYFWSTVTSASASKRNYSMDVATGASFGAQFSGDSITWVFNKNSASGIAKVTIDGVAKGTVDLYNATPLYKQTQVYSGLGAGNHTIVIANNKTKNAASSNTFITHDAFLANGINDAADPTPYMENNYDGETWYKWSTITNAGASGGNYSMNVATGATVACEFSGSSITWKYTTNPACGKALVYIDGVLKDTVDQYSPGVAYQVSKTYGTLAAATHIIMIANSKTKNAASSNTFITNDAFVIGATTIEN